MTWTAYSFRSAQGEVLALPDDGNRYELFDGELLVRPTPSGPHVMPGIPASGEWADFPNPILVIEVLSPSTARHDRFVKRRRFQRTGIPEYWVVDLDASSVDRWRPGDLRPELIDDQIVWHPEGAAKQLAIDLPAFFAKLRDPRSNP